jgi:uncharacterized membrane protein YedE/YeeE
VLIGLAALLLWLGIGRIAGISGIVGNLIAPGVGERGWRLAFIAGLVAAPLLFGLLRGAPPTSAVSATPAIIVIGGLLVGFGTRLGGGCTSGHGVCGLARLSPRSLVATALFMACGVATVFVTRHWLGA